MTTITFTVGPPGAGKTYWAQGEVATRGTREVQRASLDDLLTMQGVVWPQLTGQDIKLCQRLLINLVRTIAESGRSVIVDGLHLDPKFPNLIRDELGDQYLYHIEDFTTTPVWECIEYDSLRRDSAPQWYAGEETVRKLHMKGLSLRTRFGGPGLPMWVEELNRSDNIEPYEPDESLPKAVVVDVDGTLALNHHRSPYDTSQYHTDVLEHRLARLVSDLTTAREPYQVVVLTGRDEEHRAVLYDWFEEHKVYWDECHMRPRGDSRRDNVVKLELFDKHVRHRYNVISAFDDRDRVVRLWRRLGLLTNQVAFGDF